MTVFQERVYEVVRRIPRGRVSTYGEVARLVGGVAAQAVGQALKRNPDVATIPCHRVVGADGRVGGYFGRTESGGEGRKRRLLVAEGVVFLADGRVDLARSGWRVAGD
ncbi:MAG: MGMT family protein [Kiritimatiellia bacterium]